MSKCIKFWDGLNDNKPFRFHPQIENREVYLWLIWIIGFATIAIIYDKIAWIGLGFPLARFLSVGKPEPVNDESEDAFIGCEKIMVMAFAGFVAVFFFIWCIGLYFLFKTTLFLTAVIVLTFLVRKYDLTPPIKKEDLREAGVQLEQK